MSAGGSYGVFAASAGMANQSAQSIATKYCSSDHRNEASKSAYKNYVESISNNAYRSYERCKELENSELQFSVDTAAILPREFSFSASFAPRYNIPSVKLRLSPSDGVTCKYNGQVTREVILERQKSVDIDCNRTDQTKPSFLTVINSDSSNPSPLTFPWAPYNNGGYPIYEISALNKKIDSLEHIIPFSLTGTISIQANGTSPLTDTSQCLPPPQGYRGEMNGRVNFTRGFKNIPIVNIGISSFNISSQVTGLSSEDQSLAVAITSIDTKGFNYNFYTWCKTKIGLANATWIAIGN